MRAPTGRHAGLIAQIDALAARSLTHPVAGLAIAVVWRGETVLARGYGLADIAEARPAAADSIFRIASVAKTFTAAAVLTLAAAGKLRLDDPIGRHLPSYPARGNAITIRQLLTHTSGLGNFIELPWSPRYLGASNVERDKVAAFAHRALEFRPGERWQYSNAGYNLLALIVEEVSGRGFPDYLRSNVFAPAGLTDTSFCRTGPRGPRAARGYRVEAGKLVRAEDGDMSLNPGAGALCSTVTDLVAWSAALAAYRVVGQAAWKEMIAPVRLRDGTLFPHGLGIAMGNQSGHPSLGTRGSMPGFVSAVDYYPGDDLHIAVLANTESDIQDPLILDIAAAVLGLAEAPTADLPVPPARAAAIVGTYRFRSVGVSFEVFLERGALMIRNTTSADAFRLRLQRDGTYFVSERRRKVTFELGPDGKVTRMKLEQGALQAEGVRVP